jgi:hypothetical protein
MNDLTSDLRFDQIVDLLDKEVELSTWKLKATFVNLEYASFSMH